MSTLEVLAKVTSLLDYSVQSLNQDVKKVTEWLKKQPHLPETMDPKKIQNFLILNKGSVEITKQKIDRYYSMRSDIPHFFDEINPKLPYMQKNYDTFYFFALPRLTTDMFRVFYFKIRDTNMTEKFDPVYIARYMLNFQEIRLVEDVTFGDIFILDGKDVPLNFLLNFTPTFFYTLLVRIYKNVYSNRMKALHIVNAPSFAQKLFYTVVRPIIGAKVTKRIFFHDSYDFLTEEFGEKMIPCDFGGQEKSIDELQRLTVEKFEEYADLFDGLDKLRVCEELRPLGTNSVEELRGNFKKLDFD